ncbi:MAG: hypothetical protein CMJ50_08830 [Planctomycetaceae bacterium]|nr:hypothetical protein [Planctomycetaceae bacterium]
MGEEVADQNDNQPNTSNMDALSKCASHLIVLIDTPTHLTQQTLPAAWTAIKFNVQDHQRARADSRIH